jgi:hypothetical protein
MTPLPHEGTQNYYYEAEKGTLEAPSNVATIVAIVKAECAAAASTEVVPTSNVVVTRLPAKPKKKVSRWILWKLWFNTYRCVTIESINQPRF